MYHLALPLSLSLSLLCNVIFLHGKVPNCLLTAVCELLLKVYYFHGAAAPAPLKWILILRVANPNIRSRHPPIRAASKNKTMNSH